MPARHRPPQVAIAAVLLVVAVLVAGASAGALTHSEMYAQWAGAAERFEEERTILPPDCEDALWVQRVGGRIVESWPDRRWVTHEFLVVDDPVLDAWSFPLSPVRHRVYVTTGLLELIRQRGGAQRDDQLAGVLGHELAHLMRDHHLLRHRREEMLGLEAPEDPADWPARVLSKWRQEDELEADRYGAFYVLHAGYRFDGITDFLAQCLRRHGDSAILAAAGSPAERPHPPLTIRIAALEHERDIIEQAKQLFRIGLDLLRVGAWDTARACFAQVRSTFLLSPIVVHNVAYAELKQYEVSTAAGPSLEQSISTSYAMEPLRLRDPSTIAESRLLLEAQADFLKACELDATGGFLPPRLGLACVYLYEGDDLRAQACLRETKAGLDDPGYLNLTGVVAERSGDSMAAQRAYLKALGLSAQAELPAALTMLQRNARPHLPALYNLAHLLHSQARHAEAAELYRLYLTFEGTRSGLGARAREGVLSCGGQLASLEEKGVIDTYRGVDVRASGSLVVKAALGEPDSICELPTGRDVVTLYEYRSQGVEVLLAPRPASEAVVKYICLSAPNSDPVAGIRIGDSAVDVERELGPPREVATEPGGASWWDYARCGFALRMVEGEVERCLIGGWR